MNDSKRRNRKPAQADKQVKNQLNVYADINDYGYHYSWMSVSSVDSELSLSASTGEHVS